MPYAKNSISHARLREIMLATITEPGEKFLHLDDVGMLEAFKPFYLSIAAETPKLNDAAVAKIAVDLYALNKKSAGLFAQALTKPLAYARVAWNKATTGEKLQDAVKEVSLAMQRGDAKHTMPFISAEAGNATKAPVKKEPGQLHRPAPSSPPPAAIKKEPGMGCITSPTEVLRMYGIPQPKRAKVAAHTCRAQRCAMHTPSHVCNLSPVEETRPQPLG